MHRVFFDMLDTHIVIYLDDILIFSRTEEEHKRILDEVFRRLAKHKLFVKETKCALFLSEVEFLGHVISAQGVSV